MSVVCRPARAEDLEAADALVVRSINELTERHGFGAIASPRTPRFQLFSLQDAPDGLWVAEDAGKVHGFGFSWTCDDLWFLAQLFVSPDQQGRGVGDELMRKTLEHAQKAGATRKALITFAFNRVSQGLYMRHGLYPWLPLNLFSIARERLQAKPAGALLETAPLTPAHLQDVARIDQAALGVSREKHHRFLLGDPTSKALALYANRECAGYAYVSADGHIGPLAVSRPELMGPAFATALHVASEGASSGVSAFVPGIAEAVVDLAVGRGMRIALPMVLMSSTAFGNWRQYVPRNPGFM